MVDRKSSRIGVLCLAALMTLSGCGGPPVRAPFYHGPPPEHYQVRRGDTLYSIGQRFDIDHKRIMRWNEIRSPEDLRVGQRLRLQPPSGEGGQETVEASEETIEEVATKAAPRVVKARIQEGRAKEAPVNDAGGDPDAPAQDRQTDGQSADEPSGGSPESWRWPLEGRIIRQFSGQGRDVSNGIDIAAEAGTEVRAAANGEVVYSGDGLRGYGNLVIIRHGGGYITTYAYNRVNLVAEEDEVAAGDVVARVGQTGSAERESLHFEVRRRTDPIDPLEVLPAR